jgi:hypothetical protein
MVLWPSSRYRPTLFNPFLLFHQILCPLYRRNRLCFANDRLRPYRYLPGRIRLSSSAWTNCLHVPPRLSWSSLLYSERNCQDPRLSRDIQVPRSVIDQTSLPITRQFLECASRSSSPPIFGPKPTMGHRLIFLSFSNDFPGERLSQFPLSVPDVLRVALLL